MVALEIELSRAATAHDRTAVSSLARLVKKTAAAVGLTIATTATALVIADVHDALTAVDTQADRVIECVIEADERIIDAGDSATAPSEVTLDPAELNLDAVPLQPEPAPSGGEAGRDVELGAVMDGGTIEMSGDLAVTHASDDATAAGTAGVDDGLVTIRPGTIDAGAEVHEPQVVEVGMAVEHDEALPISPSRTGSAVIGTVVDRAEALPVTPRGGRGLASRFSAPF